MGGTINGRISNGSSYTVVYAIRSSIMECQSMEVNTKFGTEIEVNASVDLTGPSASVKPKLTYSK